MTGSPRRPLIAAVAAIASVLCIAACGSSNEKSSSGGSEASTKGASKPTLLVYSAQGYSPNSVKEFEKATGTPTKLVENSTGPLLAPRGWRQVGST